MSFLTLWRGRYFRRFAYLIAILCSAAGILGTTASARAESPAAYMQRVANELIAASRTGSASAIAAVIRAHGDIPSIGLTALGTYKERLPESERPAYYTGMINFIARYGAKEAPKYPVAKAVMVGQSQQSSQVTHVDSRIFLRDGAVYDVRWVIVRRGSGYKVRDAEILMYRMTSFLDTLFQNYIGDNNGDPKKLVMALNK